MKLFRPALLEWTWCPLAVGLATQNPELFMVTLLFSTLLIVSIYLSAVVVIVVLVLLQSGSSLAATELLVLTATPLIPPKQELARARAMVPLEVLVIRPPLTMARERLLTKVLKLAARVTILLSA